jgi:hypothetical protein
MGLFLNSFRKSKMKNTFKCTPSSLIIIVFLCAFSGTFLNCIHSARAENPICSAGEAPPWPLRVLTKDEREARIRFLIAPQQFQLNRASKDGDVDDCNKVLKKLEAFNGIQVLEAKYSNQKLTSPPVQNIIGSCQNLAIDKINYSPDDYLQATANMEFYDLSSYLGEGTWGYLAEGMLRHCKESGDESCNGLIGYLKYSGSLSRVFDKKSCEIISDMRGHGQRIHGVLELSPPECPKNYYAEMPNFIAFVSVDGTLYRIEFTTTVGWDHFNELVHPNAGSTAQLFINTFSRDNAKRQSCYFTSKNFPKLEAK